MSGGFHAPKLTASSFDLIFTICDDDLLQNAKLSDRRWVLEKVVRVESAAAGSDASEASFTGLRKDEQRCY